VACDDDTSAVWTPNTGDHVQDGRLAGAGGTEQGRNTTVDFKGDV
jgi:hypothetical protein